MNLNNNIRKFRKELNLSQKELASKAGLAYNTITKIEENLIKYPSIQTIDKIAKALNKTIDNLI